jgi:DinB superfamily
VPSIERRLRAIETKRSSLIDLLSGVDPNLIAARPQPGKWSIQEIVEHLVLSEVAVFGVLNTLEGRAPQPRTLRHRVLYVVVMFILRFDIPVRVPSPDLKPRGGRSIEELRAQWETHHRLLRTWIESSEPSALARPLFAHPIAGPMTTAEALRMLEVHLDRHVRQIRARRLRS